MSSTSCLMRQEKSVCFFRHRHRLGTVTSSSHGFAAQLTSQRLLLVPGRLLELHSSYRYTWLQLDHFSPKTHPLWPSLNQAGSLSTSCSRHILDPCRSLVIVFRCIHRCTAPIRFASAVPQYRVDYALFVVLDV